MRPRISVPKGLARLAKKAQPTFDPKAFLATVSHGRSVAEYSKGSIVFLQSSPADAVFYIQKGKVKVTVVSDKARKLSSQSWERMSFSAKDVSADRLSA